MKTESTAKTTGLGASAEQAAPETETAPIAAAKPLKKPSRAKLQKEYSALIDRAKKGDRTAIPHLTKLVDLNPELIHFFGNLAAEAEAGWIKLAAGENLMQGMCMARNLDAYRLALGAGTARDPLDKLLIERVVMAKLQADYFDALEPRSANVAPQIAAYRMKRQEMADRRLPRAIATLATYRKFFGSPPAAVPPGPVAQLPAPMAAAQPTNGHSGRKTRRKEIAEPELAPMGTLVENRLALLFGKGDDGASYDDASTVASTVPPGVFSAGPDFTAEECIGDLATAHTDDAPRAQRGSRAARRRTLKFPAQNIQAPEASDDSWLFE